MVVVPGKDVGSRYAILAVVTTVWRNSKKPQVTNLPTSLGHVVAFRCLELQGCPGFLTKFQAHQRSKPWVLRPESVVAILDVQDEELKVDRMVCQLTESSMSVWTDLNSSVADWWPVPEDEPTQGSRGLYKRKRRQRTKKNSKKKKSGGDTKETEAEVPADDEEANGMEEKEKKSKGKSKKKKSSKDKKDKEQVKKASGVIVASKSLKKLKKVEKAKVVPFQPKNFKKIGDGPTLVVQTMNRLRKAELGRFKDPSFSLDGVCRLPGNHKFKEIMWEEVVMNAHQFFVATSLGMLMS